MVDTSEKLDVARCLRETLNSGQVKDQSDAALAQSCLQHLMNRVRLSVMGPGCKDAIDLANLLIGRPLLPGTAVGQLVHLEEGEATEAIAHLRNGETKIYSADAIKDGFDEPVRLMQITSDVPTLVAAAINCATAGSLKRLQHLTDLVGPFTDIALWVPFDLCAEELDLWLSLPERVRTRGHLVLTPSSVDPALLCERAKGHFSGVIVIDPAAAIEACGQENAIDAEMLHEAGGNDLFKAIEREVELLDQSVIDEAEHLLMRIAEETPNKAAEIDRNAPTAPCQSARIASVGHRKLPHRPKIEPQAISRAISRDLPKPATPWSLGL